VIVSLTAGSTADVLSLLAAEVPEAELLATLEALRSAASSAQELAEVERIAEAALALHRSRSEDRQRAVALSALSETAADLATHRDLDTLLRAICSRARLLLGTDVAYVTLLDRGANETYVRATDGIVSESFHSMRTPLGAGIGGLVAETGRPEATADYPADTRLDHVREIDLRVASEGLHAILAVPLKRAGESFGVLLSASRVVRHFTPQEIALSASLGAHAAIALENARLWDDSRTALEELARAHALAQTHAAQVHRLAAAQTRLAAVALEGGGLQALVEEAASCVAGWFELRDASGELLASAGTAHAHAPFRYTARIPGSPGALGLITLASAVEVGIEQEFVDRIAGFAASILLQQRVQSEAEYRYRSRILEEMLEGRRALDDDTQRWLTRAGITVDQPHVVLVTAFEQSSERWGWLTVARAAVAEHGLVGTVSGRIVVIVPGDDPSRAAERWGSLVRGAGSARPTIGAALGTTGMHALPTAYRDATAALSLLVALGRHGEMATIAQLGIFGHMLSEPGRADLPRFLQRTLGVLTQHDARSRSPVLPVLDAFFAESGHLGNTARRLNVHINTLYQRLERIDELLGRDWRTADRRLQLHIALRLRALDLQLAGQDDAGDSPSSSAPSDSK
jgi:sugar diacid utilization regulator